MSKQYIQKLEEEREELLWTLDSAMRHLAHYISEDEDSENVGWWDSMALSVIQDIGDTLVEAGLWERHPEGIGRRWFYRPIKQKS